MNKEPLYYLIMITYKSGNKIVAPFKKFKIIENNGITKLEWEEVEPMLIKIDERITCKRPIRVSVDNVESVWQVDEIYE